MTGERTGDRQARARRRTWRRGPFRRLGRPLRLGIPLTLCFGIAFGLALTLGPATSARAQAASASTAQAAPDAPSGAATDPGPASATEPAPTTGPVTGLPMPRYVSLKATKANVRRGPGMTHRVDWVFMRRGMPLEVIAEYGHWRRVRDQEGGFGWVHYSMLSGVRTALVTPVEADLREDASTASPVVARAAPGVVLKVEACGRDWCEVYKDGVEGWLPKTALWGVAGDEIFD
ncbi:MAG: hypothetical protein CML46_03010 [Rhodobacteraceae bacterium]|nr:hypothetical protein [Paracoccaceae bacterium]MBR25910.1 hypothetical protein [Paracoccaceae bacterium]